MPFVCMSVCLYDPLYMHACMYMHHFICMHVYAYTCCPSVRIFIIYTKILLACQGPTDLGVAVCPAFCHQVRVWGVVLALRQKATPFPHRCCEQQLCT